MYCQYKYYHYWHELVVSDDFHRHLLASTGSVSGSDNIAENTLPCVAIDIVALIQHLTNVHT